MFRQTYRLPLADTFYSFIVPVAVCVHCADAVSCWPLVIAVSGFIFFLMGFVFLLSSFPIYMCLLWTSMVIPASRLRHLRHLLALLCASRSPANTPLFHVPMIMQFFHAALVGLYPPHAP